MVLAFQLHYLRIEEKDKCLHLLIIDLVSSYESKVAIMTDRAQC